MAAASDSAISIRQLVERSPCHLSLRIPNRLPASVNQEQMSIATALLIRLMADPIVDESLIDILRRTVADETVTKDVPPSDVLPFAFVENFRQVIPSVVWIQRKFVIRVVDESVHRWIKKQKRTRWLHLSQSCRAAANAPDTGTVRVVFRDFIRFRSRISNVRSFRSRSFTSVRQSSLRRAPVCIAVNAIG